MVAHLFQEPISAFVEQKLREARNHAEQLTSQQLEGSDISARLETIATFEFKVASLRSDQRKGKRRTEKQRRMDYGREIIVDVDIIDVTIPFDGWPKSFHLAPSSCRIIETPAVINNDSIIQISFVDDQNLEQNIESFVQAVTQNLNTLRAELQRIRPQMLQAAQLVANQRLQQMRERKARDKTRSFPIE
jgi:hypothetical protein